MAQLLNIPLPNSKYGEQWPHFRFLGWNQTKNILLNVWHQVEIQYILNDFVNQVTIFLFQCAQKWSPDIDFGFFS